MNKYSEIITRYITGKMSETEKKDFEKQLAVSSELKSEYDLQLQTIKGIRRTGIKTEVKKGFNRGSLKSKLFKIGTVILITALATTVILVAKEKLANKSEKPIRYESNEENTKQWSDADKSISPQIFEINTSADTVIETKEGIIFSIPAHAFKSKSGDADGTVELEVKEAMNPGDIMKAGLSTMSDGKLLETGGMFYLNARQDGENLSIKPDKGIYASIPDKNPGKNMMLFEGKRTDDGQINWVNPKPFENNLIPVDILGLNFYPPHFLDTLKSMGYDISNKKLTDSIYYSLSCYHGEGDVGERTGWGKADSVERDISPQEIAKMEAQAQRQADSISKAIEDYMKANNIQAASEPTVSKNYSGEQLFKQNCSVCHSISKQKITGPGLIGVFDRVPNEKWMESWIANNERLIKKGDPYANKVFSENGKAAMPVFVETLSKEEIRTIIDYIRQENHHYEHTHSPCEIDPSKIHAIWDQKFNNTILATKEFEERLQVIFTTCNSELLELYVQNANKKMYELDSIAYKIEGETSAGHKFFEFFKQRKGSVNISSSHMKKLQEYFKEKQKLYKEATITTLKNLYNNEASKKEQAEQAKNEHEGHESIRKDKVFQEEYQSNLKEAYRQLGKEWNPTPPPAQNYLSATITTPGWKNVDAYVMESTTNRTTLDYTDRQSGKKAVIKYEPFTLKVTDQKNYDRVFAYLLPDKLSSFQRMPQSGDVFKENLNELFKYGVVVLGFKGEDIFMGQIADAKPGEGSVSLGKISKEELNQFRFQNSGANIDIVSELNYQLFEQKENLRIQAIKDREMIRYRLMPVVFPCWTPTVH